MAMTKKINTVTRMDDIGRRIVANVVCDTIDLGILLANSIQTEKILCCLVVLAKFI